MRAAPTHRWRSAPNCLLKLWDSGKSFAFEQSFLYRLCFHGNFPMFLLSFQCDSPRARLSFHSDRRQVAKYCITRMDVDAESVKRQTDGRGNERIQRGTVLCVQRTRERMNPGSIEGGKEVNQRTKEGSQPTKEGRKSTNEGRKEGRKEVNEQRNEQQRQQTNE